MKSTPALALLALGALVTGGTQNAETDTKDASARSISVESSADECALSATEAPAGKLTFSIKNTGSDVTEFYLLAPDGLRIISEVENIGPGRDHRDHLQHQGDGSADPRRRHA